MKEWQRELLEQLGAETCAFLRRRGAEKRRAEPQVKPRPKEEAGVGGGGAREGEGGIVVVGWRDCGGWSSALSIWDVEPQNGFWLEALCFCLLFINNKSIEMSKCWIEFDASRVRDAYQRVKK